MSLAPHPALVTQQAAQRLPRWPLLMLCAAYVLPGVFERDPWRGADLTAFGRMLAMAEGRTSWWQAALGGVPTDAALLPHWIGAAAIALAPDGMDAALAARLPFALLLGLTLVAVWYACYHLALSDAAQPMPLAFGGEAAPVDYARAVADGALLALIASLGLLQLGHETTPELAQLAATAGALWALAARPRRGWRAGLGLVISLGALAASGAPSMALAMGVGALALSWLWAGPDSEPGRVPAFEIPKLQQRPATDRAWILAAMGMAVAAAWPTHTWAWRLHPDWWDVPGLLRQWAWFLWPSWLLALWTLWRWRGHWRQRHIALPGWLALVAIGASVGMGGYDRALMLALPGLAVLAAFALPTLTRSASAAVDWFSVFFFSFGAAFVWLLYLAMQTGVPARAAAIIPRLAPGFEPQGSVLAVLLGGLGTLAWLGLVRWRTGRHRAALWKSLVLPAGGVALLWLLLMTLWLPLLDYARSNRPLALKVARHVPAGACVAAPEALPNLVAALEWHARLTVDARASAMTGACPVLVLVRKGELVGIQERAAQQAGWQWVATERRPTERREFTQVYRRPAPGR